VLILTAASSSAAATRHVLLLHSFEREFAPFDSFVASLRTELSRRFPEPINFVEVSLQPARFGEIPQEAPVVNYLLSILASQPMDLAVSIGAPAAMFAQRHREQLFPAVPMLLAAVERRLVRDQAMTANDAAVAVTIDAARGIENILKVLPRTRTVFVVTGASQFERFWRVELDREFRRFTDRLTFIWSDQLSFENMLERGAALPPDSVIYFTILSVDAAGVSHTEERALTELHAVANAPIFGFHSRQLGQGIVGGLLLPVDAIARTTANAALRILQGEAPRNIGTTVPFPGQAAYDWRELRRWGISESLLPVGSAVQFREPTTWERYRWQILGTVSVGLAEALLVVALVANHVKRRRAEQSLRESEERFRRLSDTAPVMIWMAGPDKLCTDVNRSWLDFTGRPIEAELGNGWTEGVHADDTERSLDTYIQAFDRREPFRMEYRLRRHDGLYRWILDTGVPRYTPDGSFAGYIGSAIDVTEIRLAKEALSGLSHKLMEAQEQERSSIARELHDDLSQRMVGLTMQLHSASQARPDNINDLRVRIGDLCNQFVVVGRDIQAISYRLHSSKLQLLGITAAATSLCQDLAAQQGVTIDFTHDGVPQDLSKDVELVLFRVLQEALSNAVKHSGVRHVDVSLRGSAGRVELEVADNGIGFDPETAMSSYGLGLVSMRERLSLIRGELFIDSRSGAGTRIRASVPLQQKSETFIHT
jgi:PAS domain S-box-containing protein